MKTKRYTYYTDHKTSLWPALWRVCDETVGIIMKGLEWGSSQLSEEELKHYDTQVITSKEAERLFPGSTKP